MKHWAKLSIKAYIGITILALALLCAGGWHEPAYAEGAGGANVPSAQGGGDGTNSARAVSGNAQDTAGDTAAVSGNAQGVSGTADVPGLDLSAIENYVEQIDREVGSYIPELNLKDFFQKLLRGEVSLSPVDMLNGLLKYLFREVVANSRVLGKLVLLAVLAALLQNLQSAFSDGTTGKIAGAVVYLVLITVALGSFNLALNIGRDAIDNMVSFMQALLPTLYLLLAAVGNLGSAALFQPLMMGVLTVLSTIVKNVVFPLIFFTMILNIVSNLFTQFPVSRLAGLLKDMSLGILGLCFSIFLGFLTIQGVGGAVADGVALRTVKFATGTFIPVVGGMLSDAVEAVAGTSLVLKNAVGIVGVIIVFILCAFPMIKILSLVLIYKIASAIVQPISDSSFVDSINSMGNGLALVFAAVAAVGVMFFFVITIVVGAGNMTVMLR